MRRQHLTLQLPADTAMVTGDKKRLVQVISNLLTNAAKYTQEGGTIRLTMETGADNVTLTVEDNGIGMAPELTKRVFELFAQAERTSDRSAGGLGLGLALVKNLVELHGGTVACFSAGIGMGSRFSFCLPRLPDIALAAELLSTAELLTSARSAMRIMIVDDNADAALMLSMFLEASGYDVIVENDARQALERARTDAPDVCLLDIGLPGMDGNELARRLRALPDTAQATLIAVTGYGQEHDRANSLATGFDHHMVKPVDTGKLTVLLATLSAPAKT